MVRKSVKNKSRLREIISLSMWFFFIMLFVLTLLVKLYPAFQYYSMSDEQRVTMGIGNAGKDKGKSLNLVMDIKGFIHFVMSKPEKMGKPVATDPVDKSMTFIGNRIDRFGLTEPIVQKHSENNIIVALHGMSDIIRVTKLIRETVRLEFRLLI
jgi:hypothetical protein